LWLLGETLFEGYVRVWAKAADRVAAMVAARRKEPDSLEDTHPGLAERCGGRDFPLPLTLLGGFELAGLDELDRRCTANLTQRNCRYPVQVMPWSQITPEVIAADVNQ
jgi:hypothetical protein